MVRLLSAMTLLASGVAGAAEPKLPMATDGYLYVTANQLHRQAQFHDGKDLRKKPYALFRLKIDGGPVLLGGRR